MSIRSFALCSALLMTAAPAGAQQFNDWLTPRPGYTVGSGDESAQYGDARRIAYDNGYREGVERGEKAVRDRRALDVEREQDYRNADNGYNRSFGDQNLYRDMFRSGFADGYRTAYNRYGYNGGYSGGPYYGRTCRAAARHRLGLSPAILGRIGGYGNGSVYGSSYAFQNGVNDGYQKGRDDAQDRKYPDDARQKWYRSGDRHYDNRYGSRDVYEDQYRRGFQEGYDRAYRELRSVLRRRQRGRGSPARQPE